MHDDRELARHGDDGTAQAAPLGDGHAPGLEYGPALDPREQGQRSLDEGFAYRPVASLGNRSVAVDFAGSVFARREAEMRTEIAGVRKTRRIVDAGGVGQRDNGADARDREEAPAYRARSHGFEHHPMQHTSHCCRSTTRAASMGLTMASSRGCSASSSSTLAANAATVTAPSLRPKALSVPRILLSIATRFSSSVRRLLSKRRSSWLSVDLTWTVVNHPTRMACAMARASLRSVLTAIAAVAPFKGSLALIDDDPIFVDDTDSRLLKRDIQAGEMLHQTLLIMGRLDPMSCLSDTLEAGDDRNHPIFI